MAYKVIGNDKAKSYTVFVTLIGVLNEAEELKELVLVFVVYTCSCVYDLYLQIFLLIALLDNGNLYLDRTPLSEL